MNRTAPFLFTVPLLALAACSAPADAGTVPPLQSSESPSVEVSAPPATSPAAPEAGGRDIVPVSFGRSVTTPEGLVVTFADIVGHRPGESPNADDAVTVYADEMPTESVILRVEIHNGSSTVMPLEHLRFFFVHDGRLVSDIPMVDRDARDVVRDSYLEVGGDYAITVVLPGSPSDRWGVVVRDTDMSTGEKVVLAAALTEVGRPDMSTQMRVPSPLPDDSGDGTPAVE